MFNKSSTFILKLTVAVLGLIVLALAIFALPSAWKNGPLEFPGLDNIFHVIVVGMYATMIPFYYALWQTLKLLKYIDDNTAFSEMSVLALKKIKYSAILISIFYMTGLPLLYPIAEMDDAPGLLLFGFVIACAPIVVAVFAAVLHRLLRSAIEIKSENELTV